MSAPIPLPAKILRPLWEKVSAQLTDEGSRWPCHSLGASAPLKMTANPRESTRTVPGPSKRPVTRNLLASFRVGSRFRIGPPAACTQVGNLSATPHPSRSRGPPSPTRGEGKMRRFVNSVAAAPRGRRGGRLRVSDMCESGSSASPRGGRLRRPQAQRHRSRTMESCDPPPGQCDTALES